MRERDECFISIEANILSLEPSVFSIVRENTVQNANIYIEELINETPEILTELIKRRTRMQAQEVKVLGFIKYPYKTFKYFFLFIVTEMISWYSFFLNHLKLISIILFMISFLFISYGFYMGHRILINQLKAYVGWYVYWIILGIFSTIGTGGGLHTFFLFLGPLIMNVTLIASECKTLEFDIRHLREWSCPIIKSQKTIGIWDIFQKIKWECFLWGFGTALGELPPYFMARAARLMEINGPNYKELDSLEQYYKSTKWMLFLDKLRLKFHRLTKYLGFWTILFCASIPNPLFDIVGFACGHFLTPFKTFFIAIVLGKAIFKVFLQSLCIILLFSDHQLEALLENVKNIAPLIYTYLSKTIKMQKEKYKFPKQIETVDLFSQFWNYLSILIFACFILSTIRSMAKSYLRKMYNLQNTVLYQNCVLLTGSENLQKGSKAY